MTMDAPGPSGKVLDRDADVGWLERSRRGPGRVAKETGHLITAFPPTDAVRGRVQTYSAELELGIAYWPPREVKPSATSPPREQGI
jgi:hypothetical protein